MDTQRTEQLKTWLNQQLPSAVGDLVPLSGDASFRKYYRINPNGKSLIAVDSDPQYEKNHAFVSIANMLAEQNICVPEIKAVDFFKGFMLLSDLGEQTFLPLLNKDTVDELYGKAMDTLLDIQSCDVENIPEIPHFSEDMLSEEFGYFTHWYLDKNKKIELTDSDAKLLEKVSGILTENVQEQPQVFVHRDYHSRNLLQVGRSVGVLDFQDAVIGPVTYDIVSLLRDLYIAWPAEQVYQWAFQYKNIMTIAGIIPEASDEKFKRWFDLMGVQRQIKNLGVFSRLAFRDNKPNYLNDIPTIMKYLDEVLVLYPEFKEFKTKLNIWSE